MLDIILLLILILIIGCIYRDTIEKAFGKLKSKIMPSRKENLTFPIPMESAVETNHIVPADIAYESVWPRYVTKDGNENIMLRNALKEKTKFVKQVIANSNNPFQVDKDIAHGLYPKAQGWWADAINCEQNANHLYCKSKDKWIWPY